MFRSVNTMKKTIRTVLGDVSEDDVRLICPHEHLFVDAAHEAVEPRTEEEKRVFYGKIEMRSLGVLRRNPYIVRENLVLDSLDDALDEISFLEACNCNLLIDLTSVGLGRDVQRLVNVARNTDVHIVCGCGLFVHETIPGRYSDMTERQIADEIVREIRCGISGTPVRPGVIGEIGVSEEIRPIERKSLASAGIASAETGLPVYVHTYPWSRAGLEAIGVLREYGVSHEKICVCHLDVSFDPDYMRRMLDLGVWLVFDNLGKEFYFPSQDSSFGGGPFETDIARARMIARLAGEGYAGQLLISNDLCLKAMLHKYGGWGYDHMFTNFVPMMRMEGVPEEAVRRIVEVNPKRFLFGG